MLDHFATGWDIAAVVLCASWVYLTVRMVVEIRARPVVMETDAPAASPDDPPVCAIVPACDESAAIEACLQSLLDQDYSNLRIVAVNDRSRDDTGARMQRLAERDPRIAVVQIDELPAGWLGKNHANWVGARHPFAQEAAFVLFTDGDIVFASSCVRRAMASMRARGQGMLSVLPDLIRGGVLENAICVFFAFCYLLKCKPWHLDNPRRKDAFVGVGAFNLVERAAYHSIGGHEALRMEVVDDYKLGKLMKGGGHRCELLAGGGALRVRWQNGLRGVVRGLEKNAFAGFNYSLAWMGLALGAFAFGFLVPWLMIPWSAGWARWAWAISAALPVGLVGWFAIRARLSPLYALLTPVCGATLFWACIRATYLTLRRQGIVWRGTFYPLKELRAGSV